MIKISLVYFSKTHSNIILVKCLGPFGLKCCVA
jgi:hypothetical protein